ncbi:myb/SANT-like DNA-binding domain-containing protein 4, partial [Bactrocera neohumeralis]|uniref:myb/SANT-like DNA-binding domain-containing protein 4 n=1 Tax=Bactrocera neohumeralis TaxID=98809 RepID=UPI002165676A
FENDFLSALKWKGQTGAGLLESGDPHSVEEYIKRICPFYEDLHVIFGRRISVQPPAIYQSTELVSALDDTYIEYTPEIDPDTSSSSPLPSPSVIMYPSANEVVSPPANFACTSTPRRNMKRSHSSSNPFSLLFEIQNKKLELEMKKLEIEKEREENSFQLQKLRLEKEMEVEMEKVRLEHERLKS